MNKKKYDLLLINSDIQPKEYPACRKWLRFYLDFCRKYEQGYADHNSLILFIDKLKSKNRNSFQQEQAQKAVRLYYSGLDKKIPAPAKGSPPSAGLVMEEPKAFNIDKRNTQWDVSINTLKNEILTRHYSKKTLKAYSLWAEKLRYFAKEKVPDSLTIEDVKEFLTFLAVKKKVSASSQNQAFNALLFYFRHVLKKEFGKMEGIVRAKRKPYIPVVLSRDEVDRVIRCLNYLYDLVVKLLYGCGLRLSECMKLRIKDFNFDHSLITVHDGKGKKDRTVPIPDAVRGELERQTHHVSDVHERDLSEGYPGVFMPARSQVMPRRLQNNERLCVNLPEGSQISIYFPWKGVS